MLFVLLHELAHVSITQMGLPVLGRMEDAANSFAALRLIDVGSEFSHRVLADAAEGWFMAHRRDEKMGEDLAFYAEHGLSRQRAYHIVCLMVGSDDEKFKDLADETKLPQARQDTCAGDYSNAAFSWGLLLKPHRRAPDQARTKIEVVYGAAAGRDAIAKQVARSTRLLETVAEHAADEFVWPAPFTLKMQSCGFANARWNIPTRTLNGMLRARRRIRRSLSRLRHIARRWHAVGRHLEAKDGQRAGIQAEIAGQPSKTQGRPLSRSLRRCPRRRGSGSCLT